MSPIYTPGKVVLAKNYVEGDRYFSNVSLLLHGNADGSGNILDSSPSPKTVSKFGNAASATPPSYPNSNSSFGNAIAFDGNGDYLASSSNAAFGMGTSDFTLEAWIRPDLIAGADRGVIDFRNTLFGTLDGGAAFIDASTSKLSFFDGVTVYGKTGTTISLNVWHHVAWVRSGNILTAYLNGVQDFTASFSVNLGASRPLGIGGSNTDTGKGASPFSGYIDDLRITKGVARYTANFTPPTAPFADAQY